MTQHERPAPAGSYKSYLLALLLVIMAFNFVDRLALGLVLQDIKVDLHLSDLQLGFMSGIAFALFYSLMGIPLARWADRGNRVTIISLTAAVWSVMVTSCGFATSFVQLLLIRIGVGVGEAGCIPPAHSLIPDYFTRDERPRAAAIYALGGPLSFLIGYLLAGWLNQLYGWRAMFMLLGLPGLVLAGLAKLTLREPRRATRARAIPDSPAEPHSNLKEVWRTLWRIESFRHLLAAFAVMFFFAYGVLQWQPTFFIRSFGLESGELGTWFALIYGVGGLVGTYCGGEVASRYAPGNEQLQLRVGAVSFFVLTFISAGVYLAPGRHVAFGLLTLFCVAFYWTSGPLLAAVQTLVPERMRATAIALVYLFANLIGMGLGPLITGALSDAYRPWAGQESLRYALLSITPGFVWVAWHLWKAGETIRRDADGRK